MWPEDDHYAQWLAADELQRSNLERELCRCIRNHAQIVVWGNLRESMPELIEDIVTTVLMQLPQFRGEAQFSTWIHKIAMNRVYGEIRKRRKQRRVFDETADLYDEDKEERFGAEPPDLTPRIDYERLFEGLSKSEYTLLTLKYENIKNPEIAAKLGITPDAVESRWRRLKCKLRKKKLPVPTVK